MTLHEIRKARKKQTAEDFTCDELVCQTLAKLPPEVWQPGKTFCDPAVGNGQFLIWVLLRKISFGQDPAEALKTLYGVDIMLDNVNECRLRLLKIIYRCCHKKVAEEHIRTVLTNIKWTDPKVYPHGSLDYNFEFHYTPNSEQVQKWMDWIYNREGKGKGIFHTFNPVTGKNNVSVPHIDEIRRLFALMDKG